MKAASDLAVRLFDASRVAKFSWTSVITDPDYIKRAGLAVLQRRRPYCAIADPGHAQAGPPPRAGFDVGGVRQRRQANAWFAAIVAFWKGH